MKMKYGINDKVPIAKAIPLALQHVFTIFTGTMAGSIALFLLGPLVIKYLHKYFTPVITGSVVLSVGMCLLTTAYGKMVNYAPDDPDVKKYFVIAIVIAVLTLVLDSFAKGFIQSLSVLIAMIVGYILCIALGMVDFSSVGTAAMFSLPTPMHFGMSFNVGAIVTVCIVFPDSCLTSISCSRRRFACYVRNHNIKRHSCDWNG